MEIIFTIDKNDYDKSWPHSKRPSVRAVIFKGDKLAMVYSTRDDYYKFPGGGVEENEAHHTALIREVMEEVGLNVIPSSIKEYGEALLLCKSDLFDNTIFEQENFYYFCETDDSISEQSLDDYEAESGFTLRYVTIEEAIRTNERYDVDFLIRETGVLRLLAEQIK